MSPSSKDPSVPMSDPVKALDRAARLTHERRYDEALGVLSEVGGNIRKGGLHSTEMIACLLFEDILSVISGKRDLHSLKLRGRNRLLKLVSFGALPFFRMMQAGGRVFSKVGFPAGSAVVDFAVALRNLGWVHGLPVRPGFMAESRDPARMEGFRRSEEAYREIFMEYLDYWLEVKGKTGDLVLATVKPGDAHALYCLVRERAPSTVLEIGTFVGFSTSIIASAMKDAGTGKLYCVDPGMKHLAVEAPLDHAESMLKRQGLYDCVTMLKGFFSDPRSDVPADAEVYGRKISERVPGVDLAFIDGDHAATAVIQDFLLLLPALNDDAVVVFHDVKSWSSVRQGLLVLLEDESLKKRIRYYHEFHPSGLDGLGVMKIAK